MEKGEDIEKGDDDRQKDDANDNRDVWVEDDEYSCVEESEDDDSYDVNCHIVSQDEDSSYDETDSPIVNIFLALHNIVIVENVDENITVHYMIDCLDNSAILRSILSVSFVPESRGNGFVFIVECRDNQSAGDFAFYAHRNSLFGSNVFSCIMSDCIRNLKELEFAFSCGDRRDPDEVTFVSEDTDLDITVEELVKRFSLMGEVTSIQLFVEDGLAKDRVHIKYKYLSEALAAEFAISAKRFESYLLDACAYVSVNMAEACRNLVRGAFTIPNEVIKRDEIALPDYINMGCVNQHNFDRNYLNKCDLSNCPICGILDIKNLKI